MFGINRRLGMMLLPLVLLLGVAGCDDDDETSAPRLDLVETARAAGSFTTLLAAVEAAGLTATLQDESAELTLFAPTDAAFAALPPGTVQGLLANRAQLTAVLTYHVVPGEFSAAQVTSRTSLPTVNGKALTVSSDAGVVRVAGVRIVQTDIAARNGIIHVIDAVLVP